MELRDAEDRKESTWLASNIKELAGIPFNAS